jgi:hypothetical protein
MSAWVVSKKHIDVMVTELANQRRPDVDLNDVGQLLWAQNVKSVNYRYNETDTAETYHFEDQLFDYDRNPVVIIKAVQCWQYQSCEDPDHASSEAWEWSNAILGSAISRLPGYNDAPWGIE